MWTIPFLHTHHKQKKYSRRGLNPRPYPCEGYVITTRLPKHERTLDFWVFAKKCLFLRTFYFPSSSLYLSIKSAGSLLIHTNPQSASNWRTNTRERVRARVNKLTHEHSLSIIDHIPFHYSQKSTSPRTLRTKSLPRCFLVTQVRTIKLSVPLGLESRSSKQKQMQTHLSSLLGPLCPASGDFA